MASEADKFKAQMWRKTREEMGVSLRDTADRLQISPCWLSRLERGLEAWPDHDDSLSLDPCPCGEVAPANLKQFKEMNQTLWMMISPDAPHDIQYLGGARIADGH